MSDYKPGQLAKATVRGVPDVTVMCVDGGDWVWRSAVFIGGTRLHDLENLTDVRPLVVLDLGDDAAHKWDFIASVLRRTAHSWTNDAADQIEEQTRPAIEEPEGLGAVVEDDKGAKFVRIPDGSWDSIDTCRLWGEFTPVRVLSEGVPA